jgi:HK97 family phage prohead protease
MTPLRNVAVGYASVFGFRYDQGAITKCIERDAFRKALGSGADIKALLNHDGRRCIGSTAHGLLRVEEDDHGLLVYCPLCPSDPDARGLERAFSVGLVTGMSWLPKDQEVTDEWGCLRMRSVRRIVEVSFIISPRLPANRATVAMLLPGTQLEDPACYTAGSAGHLKAIGRQRLIKRFNQ